MKPDVDRPGGAAGRFLAVGIGEVLWDHLPTGRQLGGAPANFAFHAQALGARGTVVSAVGDDALGLEILERLAACGLDLSFVDRDRDHPTGAVSVDLKGNGTPEFTIHRDVAWDFIGARPELWALAAACDTVCFGSLAQRSPISRGTVRRFLQETTQGCQRVFDVNLRQSFYDADFIGESLRLCNVLKLNDDELPVVASLLGLTGDESAVLDQLIDRFSLEVVALTRGDRGSLLRSPNDEAVHSGYPCSDVADTVGAGDCFAACVAIGLLRGESLADASERANRRSSFVCSREGAMPEMPDE
jgi:fructokinase